MLARQYSKTSFIPSLLSPHSLRLKKRPTTTPNWRTFSIKSSLVDFRSDTVTKPSESMLKCVSSCEVGDDVYGEDPTVRELECYTANLFNKEDGIFLPTGTMANLCAILAHCDRKDSEMIVGANSHIFCYEGGACSNLGGVHSVQIKENIHNGQISIDDIRDAYRTDDDDHHAFTSLICVENTQNVLGGIPLPVSYLNDIRRLIQDEFQGPDGHHRVNLHVDGARIFHASTALDISVSTLCQSADSVSICTSKGLGAPAGSLLVGNKEFIRKTRRVRKRLGGGMRQVGVLASMSLFALKYNVDRLKEDHIKAKRFASELEKMGFILQRGGIVDTNIVYFGLPAGDVSKVVKPDELTRRLKDEYGILLGGGYDSGSWRDRELFRAVTHMDVDDEGIDRAVDAIKQICFAS